MNKFSRTREQPIVDVSGRFRMFFIYLLVSREEVGRVSLYKEKKSREQANPFKPLFITKSFGPFFFFDICFGPFISLKESLHNFIVILLINSPMDDKLKSTCN